MRGVAPPKSNTYKRAKYDKIVNCPVWKNGRQSTGVQTTLGGERSTAGQCNCGYNDFHGTTPRVDFTVRTAQPYAAPTTQPPAAAAAPKPPPVTVPFGIPEEPMARQSKTEVRNVDKIYKEEGKFDLLMFGWTCGKCPHCASKNITDSSVNKKPKLIHTASWPRYADDEVLT